MNLLYLAELKLQEDQKDYSLLDIINLGVFIRKRLDRLEYFKERYRRNRS